MQLYNTLTRRKEPFNPLEKGKVKMYVCGPTVYDFFHIGNARSFINADFVHRYFRYLGLEVKFIMNLTDVDDKIIKKSNEEGAGFSAIAKKYSDAFHEDIRKLKILPATIYPAATAHMADIIAMIEKLVEKGFAYNVEGNVFYDISKFTGYGKLSGKNTEELEAGSRVEVNSEKKNPLDFSLWKKAKEGEPYWESPWGKGRPGWHIECSAMSCKHLGKTFDIHAGGSDLIFPHHENEIAQSEAANGKPFANYWLHFGFLNIDSEKMSKSLGNFFTTRDILQKFQAETLRFFYAQTHYASPLNFTAEALEAADSGRLKIDNLFFRLEELAKDALPDDSLFREEYARFEEAMNDDINTPKALAVVFDAVKDINRHLAESNTATAYLASAKKFIQHTAGDVLAVLGEAKKEAGLESKLIELLIQLRLEARKEKNFALSDKIRDRLKEIGVILEDGKDKTSYKIV
ncbi:MAG: cysteine--tRNA ligase [Ignavibacteriaceae bacterium]|nr:cysteine--tRNA ligase [Ignavibacteriaceae bacterium]